MSGSNLDAFTIPPGIFREGSIYASQGHWYNGNLIRWVRDIMVPVGGWATMFTLNGIDPIRDVFTWRDLQKKPWMVSGSQQRLFATLILADNAFTQYNITPAGLIFTPTPGVGFGSGPYGKGAYGQDDSGVIDPDAVAQWSIDNFGEDIFAVHSHDGRLFRWKPSTPATVAVPQVGAPTDNTLVIVTDEEFVMVLGGKGNPTKFQWCSRRDPTDWAPTEINSAGGNDLKSQGSIVSAKKVQGGILVLTDTDVFIIEYVGPPYYYVPRRISDEGGILSKNAIAAIPGGAIWMSSTNFWKYDGNISRLPSTVHNEIFYNGDLSKPSHVFMGVNDFSQEIWMFYPRQGSNEANRYVIYSYSQEPWWSIGAMSRTAWVNPVWSSKPVAVASGGKFFQHELGWLDDGAPRNVFAESAPLQIGNGDNVMWVDRYWQDNSVFDDETFGNIYDVAVNDPAYTVKFKNQQSPSAPIRTVGPISLNTEKGYTTVRFRTRQTRIVVDQIRDVGWTLGRPRLRIKAGGGR